MRWAFKSAGGLEAEAVWGVLLIAVCGYVMLAPVWSPQVAQRLYDCARVLELELLAALAIAALIPAGRAAIAQIWHGLWLPARICLGVWLAGGAASAVFSEAPHMGLQQVSAMVLIAWMAFAVAAVVRRLGRNAEMAIAVALCTGAFLVSLRFWMDFVESVSSGREFSWVSPFLEFANIRFFGQYQAYVLLLVALPLMAIRAPIPWRIVIAFVASAFWMLQWIAGSRAVWVGAAVAFIAVAALVRKGRWRWLAIQGGVMLAGGVLYLGFDSFMLSTPNATPMPSHISIVGRSGESSEVRVILARSALRLIGEHPLVGVGPGQFGLHYSTTAAAHPHNTPLQLLAEYGVMAGAAGIGVGILLVVFALRELRRRTRDEPDAITTTLVAALLMGLVDALFSGNLIMPHSQILLATIAGWLLGRSPLASPAVPAPRAEVRTTLAAVAVLSAIVSMTLMLEYLDVIRDMPYPPELRIPSFWQYGRFSDW